MEKEYDILIIGAGPSGCVAAANLIKSGYRVLVVEKTHFPRFTIGESLLPRAMECLANIDAIDFLNKYNFQLKEGAVFLRNEEANFISFANNFTRGWGTTWQVERQYFDEALANFVQSKGVKILFGCSVTAFKNIGTFENELIIESENGDVSKVQCKKVIDTSGNANVISKLLNKVSKSNLPSRTAVFCHINTEGQWEKYQNFTSIVSVKEDVWAWVIPLNKSKLSVGFVGSEHHLDLKNDLKHSFLNLLSTSSSLKPLLTSGFAFEPNVLRNYSNKATSYYGDGYVLAGNSTEFLDPIFSSGATLAMVSGELAADLIDKELSAEFVNWEEEYVNKLNKGIDVFRVFVEKWYDGTLERIIYANKKESTLKKQISSVLSGYVWDEKNPFVKKSAKTLNSLDKVIQIQA